MVLVGVEQGRHPPCGSRPYGGFIVAESLELPDRTARVVRSGSAVLFASLVALASHVLAGGPAPSVLLVVGLAVVLWLPAIGLIGRRLRWRGQVAVIALTQLVFHLVFSTGAPATARTTSAIGMPGMPMDAGPALPQALPMGHAMSAWMVVAHLVAGIATVGAWRWGEAVFWRLASGVDAAVTRVCCAVLLVLPAPGLRVSGVGVELVAHRWARHHARRRPRRGPPASIAL